MNAAPARGRRRLPLPPIATAGRITAVYGASRVALLLVVFVAMVVRQGDTFRKLIAPWDVGWYIHVAEHGYPSAVPIVDGHVGQNATAFFPLYPFLIRWVDQLTPLDLLQSAVGLAVAGGLVSTILLWVLVREIDTAEVADRSAALFAFFPASFVFLIGYSEGVMLPFAIACLIALLRRQWLAAGVLAAIATLARPNAVALCVACAWAAFVAIRERGDWKALLAPMVSPLGVVAFAAFLWARTGDPTVSLKTQRYGWGQRFDFGAKSLETVRDVLDRPIDVNYVMSVLAITFVIGGLVLMVRWKPPAVLTIYTVVVLLPVLASATISSRPRFVMTAFPLLIAYARAARGSAWAAVLATSGLLLAALTLLTITTMAATP